MKKIVLLTAALVMTASLASAASIVGSAHDLSGNYGTKNLGSTEICIYCHTPHNTVQNVPLWNRNNPTEGSWQFYNSPTLTNAAKAPSFNAQSISLFCMSCHDGVTGLGNIANAGGATMDTTTVVSSANGDNIGNTGKNLTNDHPVGFSYTLAQTQDTAGNVSGSGLKADANTTLGGNAFFGAGADLMECASCHKVHNPGDGGVGSGDNKFLRISNAGSNLCLACHNK